MKLAISCKIIIIVPDDDSAFQGEHAALVVEEKLNTKNITVNGSLLRFHVDDVKEL